MQSNLWLKIEIVKMLQKDIVNTQTHQTRKSLNRKQFIQHILYDVNAITVNVHHSSFYFLGQIRSFGVWWANIWTLHDLGSITFYWPAEKWRCSSPAIVLRRPHGPCILCISIHSRQQSEQPSARRRGHWHAHSHALVIKFKMGKTRAPDACVRLEVFMQRGCCCTFGRPFTTLPPTHPPLDR